MASKHIGLGGPDLTGCKPFAFAISTSTIAVLDIEERLISATAMALRVSRLILTKSFLLALSFRSFSLKEDVRCSRRGVSDFTSVNLGFFFAGSALSGSSFLVSSSLVSSFSLLDFVPSLSSFFSKEIDEVFSSLSLLSKQMRDSGCGSLSKLIPFVFSSFSFSKDMPELFSREIPDLSVIMSFPSPLWFVCSSLFEFSSAVSKSESQLLLSS
mmetsp:Transcript_8286/g.10258  ORF Transcript_8286/g.10258 Transcript_8286/m.10258 type:complete len:213 (-) Transcript_8286:190-828(-)